MCVLSRVDLRVRAKSFTIVDTVTAGAPTMYSPQPVAGAWNDPPVVRDAPKVFTTI